MFYNLFTVKKEAGLETFSNIFKIKNSTNQSFHSTNV